MFVCNQCSFITNNKGGLNGHITRNHKELEIEDESSILIDEEMQDV